MAPPTSGHEGFRPDASTARLKRYPTIAKATMLYDLRNSTWKSPGGDVTS